MADVGVEAGTLFDLEKIAPGVGRGADRKDSPGAVRGEVTPEPLDQLLGYLEANWDTPAWSEDRIALFMGVLRQLELDVARDAVQLLIRESKEFRVKVGHLNDAVNTVRIRRREAAKAAARARLEAREATERWARDPNDQRAIEPVRKLIRRIGRAVP